MIKMQEKISLIEDINKTRERIHRQMLSTVSHDLKTPLATMIGALEVYTRMDEKLSPDNKRELVKSALGEAYRLDSFVTNILDIAKLEDGMTKANVEKCDITVLLQDCIIRLGVKVEKATVHLVPREQTDRQNTFACTDTMLLSKAVGILLDNALKHAGKKPVITIDYGNKQNHTFISVRDNGKGIDADKLEAIFSKYTRFSNTDQQNAGTGLGLAICRRVMKMLSGSVKVKNHPEGGAIFTLKFPNAL